MHDPALERRFQLALDEVEAAWGAYAQAERDLALTREWLEYSYASQDAHAVLRFARALRAWHRHTEARWQQAARLERHLQRYETEAAQFAALEQRYEHALATNDQDACRRVGLELLAQNPRLEATLATVLGCLPRELAAKRPAHERPWWRSPAVVVTALALAFASRDYFLAIAPFALVLWLLCELRFRMDARDLLPAQSEARV